MSWTDEEIDKLFRDKAGEMSFDFKPAYWEEFNAALPAADLGGMSTDFSEVDKLYQLSANELAFEYKEAYWQEVQSMLPRRKRPDFLWFGTAVLFLGVLSAGTLFQSDRSAEAESGNVAQITTTETGSENGPDQPDASVNTTTIQDQHGTGSNGSGNTALTSPENEPSLQNPLYERAVGQGYRVTDVFSPSPALINMGQHEASLPENHDAQPESIETNPSVNPQETADRTHTDEVAEPGDVNSLPAHTLVSETTHDLVDFTDQVILRDFQMPTGYRFYVELNGGLSQSLITPSGSLFSSGGAGVGMQFRKGRFTFTTGINGQWSFHNDLVLNREAKIYGFGSDVYRYTLRYDHVYSLEASLGVGYSLGRHRITAGVRPSYIIGTRVGVTMLEEDVETSRETVYGHMEGLHRFGLKPMLGYACDLKGNWTIGLNIGVQTMKAVDDSFIDGKNNTLPVDGQLFLRKGINFRR